MTTPNVTNPKLAEIVEELFQGTDKVPGVAPPVLLDTSE